MSGACGGLAGFWSRLKSCSGCLRASSGLSPAAGCKNTGWKTISGNRYYFYSNGGMILMVGLAVLGISLVFEYGVALQQLDDETL